MSDQNPPVEYVPPPPPRAFEPDVLLVLLTGFAFGVAVWNLATRMNELHGSSSLAGAHTGRRPAGATGQHTAG